MTQTREPLTIMDGGAPSLTYSSIKSNKKTYYVSKRFAILFFCVYLVSIIATGILVHNFIACKHETVASRLQAIDTRTSSNMSEELTTGFSIPLSTYQSVGNVELVKNEQDLRLPRSLKPVSYKINLLPFIFPSNFTFVGDVNIVFNVLEECDNITLHATDLQISLVEVHHLNNTLNSEERLKVTGYSTDLERQFFVVKMKRNLIQGDSYKIFLKFNGKLNDNLHGFYRSSYKLGNETRWLATTQFQPTDARRAFPCFDEPALKATFTISLAHPRNMSAISNMNLIKVTADVDGLVDYVWSHFQESLPMSTYLVAFVVSDFAKKSDGNFSVWARRDAIDTADYALEVGPKILRYFENFYKIKYPLPKIDMIALPDFGAGAMENWGLITFRETAMLYDENSSARTNKPRIATVVAHELAHQWFGNLVTPSWWSDLWLNEGFASYVEYVGIDAVENTWKSMDQFVLQEVQNVFGLDALASSHQISIPVGNPDEINDIFDKISYGKGAAIIRMMDHFLTTDVFNKGTTNYLKQKQFQSAEQNDLWAALTEQARLDKVFDKTMSVKTIMDKWTLQTGFPVVTVKRNYTDESMILTQERFVLIKSNTTKLGETKPLWWIPISYTSKSKADFISTKPVAWMKADPILYLRGTNVPADDWVIFNIKQTGFYRVNYDEKNWKMIIEHLNDKTKFESISPVNRAQILDDALNLALGGRLGYDIALDVTRYLVHEKEFVPWKAGLVGLGYIDSMLSKGPHYLEYKTYILSLIDGLYKEVGFIDSPNDTMLTTYKRIDAINIACLLDHPDCVTKAVANFYNWMSTPNPDVDNPISPNLRNTIYCTAVRVGGVPEWDFIRKRFLHATTAAERELLLTAMGCSRLPWLLVRYLDLACRNDSGIRKQDVYKVFGAVSNSVIGQPIAFSYIRQNWAKLKTYVGSTVSNLNGIVKYSTKKLNTQHELEELVKFATERKGELGRTIDQNIERTQANIVWMNKNYDIIVKWLNKIQQNDS